MIGPQPFDVASLSYHMGSRGTTYIQTMNTVSPPHDVQKMTVFLTVQIIYEGLMLLCRRAAACGVGVNNLSSAFFSLPVGWACLWASRLVRARPRQFRLLQGGL